MSTANPPAGYYADPSDPGYLRYWDGNEWVAGSGRPAPQELAEQGPASSPGTGNTDDEADSSLATMIVPSAFAHAARSASSYAYPGQGPNSNPFAGLPGAEFAPPDDESTAPGTTVVELATPGSRILARIIDLGIAVVFSAPITITLLLIAHHHDHQYVLELDAEATTTYTTLGMDALGIALWAGALLALMTVSIVYEGSRLSHGGQTIGRKLAGVRVVHMPDGAPLGRDGSGMRRALLFWILAILPLLDVLALGGVFWGRPYRQGLHERMTSTATVKI